VGLSRCARLVRAQLAGAGVFQPRDCLFTPLVALWFLDRHLAAHASAVATHLSPLSLSAAVAVGRDVLATLANSGAPDDNGLFWRITQHAGAQLLPNVSSHVLVADSRISGSAALWRLARRVAF